MGGKTGGARLKLGPLKGNCCYNPGVFAYTLFVDVLFLASRLRRPIIIDGGSCREGNGRPARRVSRCADRLIWRRAVFLLRLGADTPIRGRSYVL